MIAPLESKIHSTAARVSIVLLASALLFAVEIALSQLGVRIASMFSYRAMDASGAFAWISVHHIVQAAAALLLMGALSLFFRLHFRLGLGNRRLGMRIVLWFTVIIAAYQFLVWFALDALSLAKPFAYPLNTRNVLGVAGFQLLLSGTSEELLFRAFPITLLLLVTQRGFSLFRGRVKLPLAVVITAVLFSLAHINWSTNPFMLHYDVLQLLYAFFMGLVQGWAYVKTGSVVYPMMMHGISNLLVTLASIAMPLLF